MNSGKLVRKMLRHVKHIVVRAVLLSCVTVSPALSAMNCELNYPASDVAWLFPESTSYKTSYFSFSKAGGETLLKKVESRLGNIPGLYAPLNVPYTLYEIFKADRKIGYIHGVNQKGQFGVLEVFLTLDMNGTIKAFYLQRVAGRWANKFTRAAFGKQFIGLSLKDFEQFDVNSGKGSGKVASIVNPAPEAVTDFFGLLRAVKKNLILMDEFIYSVNKEKS